MIAVGTRLSDLLPRLIWLDKHLADVGLAVGDLVTYEDSRQGTALYRITKDRPPDGDLVWNQLSCGRKFGWTRPGSKKKVSDVRVVGSIELTLAIQLFSGSIAKKKTVPYRSLFRLKKVDILELASTFSKFQDFVKQEAKRLTSQ